MPKQPRRIDPQESPRHLLGAALRHWRHEVRNIDLRELAERAYVDFSQIAKWERAERPAPTDAITRIDTELQAGGHLIALHALVTELENLRIRQEQPTREVDMAQFDDQRRRLLQTLTALGVASATTALEPIRHALASSLPNAAQYAVSDWEEIAVEHSHTYLVTHPAEVLRDLSVDVASLQYAIKNSESEPTARALCAVGAHMTMLMAMALGGLDMRRDARNWWRVARHMADDAEKASLRAWVRGFEAMSSLYRQRPLHVVLTMTDEAIEIAGDDPDPSVLEAMATRAQALSAMGRLREAERVLHQMEPIFEKQPSISPYEDINCGLWAETALLHTRAWVYAHAGSPAADDALDAALAAYPPDMRRQAVQIKLLQAVSLVLNGNITEAVEHARSTMEALPSTQRTTSLKKGAHDVLLLIPESESNRPPVKEYRDFLTLPAAQN
ncbi:hypothetical protein SAMN04489712_10957 [Thermomonospora echinospora]|uniref:Helix-turn-helix domain-containing protein n=1 Tax=Thermomonospora echinospora TaxID=1992 RepID=A0A1H6C859_9ACTN|nr:helix-turn-helix transcriptional regulator [Thermomonospora echinospora]SEG69170.1 hypothetical protein SAMN04489712_10957 [Thermomonospora echinospora]